MKKLLFSMVWVLLGVTTALAQLASGSVCPNWTGTDLNGNTHTLYDYLDQGKTVYIDVSATWCGPCWNYHNTHALEGIWDQYGPSGTNEAMVFFIEGDGSTNTACLYGPSGCVGGTQGNWVNGTGYPIIDDASIANLLQISYYPTIYMVCPADKKIYLVGQLNTTGLWARRTQYCVLPEAEVALESTTPVRCFGTNTGAANITPSGASAPYTYLWSNGTTTQDLNNVAAGTYTVTVTPNIGLPGTLTLEVEGPPSALTVATVSTTSMGCGVFGSATVEASGGWNSNYNYLWANGQTDPTCVGLTAGTHNVTVTDAGNCSKVHSVVIGPAVLPTASIAAPPQITCANSPLQLNATNSSSGSQFTYSWTASSGGNITAGSTTLTPTISAAGLYSLTVRNEENNCVAYASTTVTGNTTAPTANAGPAQALNCAQNTTVLQGTGSSGSGFSYLWTASNGGNIQTGATTLTPTVNATGTYTLRVTNGANGCTSTAVTTVSGTTTPPQAIIANGGLSCTNTTTTLATTTTATNPSFAWTGPGGFVSAAQNPVVTTAGEYSVVITDGSTGCSGTTVATVAANTTAPTAIATGGAVTCTTPSVGLSAATNAPAATYAWTGPNNFSSTVANPTTSEVGTYTLVIFNPENGCTATATTNVLANNTPPTVIALSPSNLNCNVSQVQLNGTLSSQGANFTYQWTTASGNIVSGGNSLTPLVNQAGSYQLLVNNIDNGCTATASVALAQSPAVVVGLSAQTNVSCHGNANGTATASATGGNGTYAFSWSNGMQTPTATNLAAGTYLVIVTDSENCTAATSVTIAEPAVLAANASATAQTANGLNDGTATATPTGGTVGYTFFWNNNATTQGITGLAPGTYTVLVTDAQGCTTIQNTTVNSFNCALSAAIVGTHVTCYGAANGTASVNLVGAGSPITYAWSTGATTQSIANLAPGTFTVDVLDTNGCPATLNVAIAEPAALASNATTTTETAAGANDGTATANPTGGTTGYAFLWNNGATTQTIAGLAPGTYTVAVTDANGCVAQQSLIVNAYACAIATATSTSSVSCAGAANGTATVALTGGTAPFTYAWSSGAATATATNLAAGSYSVIVTDANLCQTSANATVLTPAAFSAWNVATTQPSCPNEATGSASVFISGGTEPYSFAWNTGAAGPILSNVAQGTYTVVLTDANGCQTSTSATLAAVDNQPPTVSVAANATVGLSVSGSATLTPALLSASVADNCTVVSTTISPNTFSCSDIGTHTVTLTVTDAAGLTATATSIVSIVDNLAPTLTCAANITICAYNNLVTYAAPVAQDNCLVTGGGLELIAGLPSGAEFPVGTTIQAFRFTDASGNSSECVFEIIVTPPVVFGNVAVTNDVDGQGVGAANVSVSGGAAPLTYAWTRDGAVVADTEDLIGVPAGTYQLVVTDANGCTYEQPSVVIDNTVAAPEPTWLSGIRFQPNPTSGITQVIFTEALPMLHIDITDATGRIVWRQVVENQSKITLDGSALPAGMYLVRLRSGAEVGTRRWVISR
jgi:hypothetical protein